MKAISLWQPWATALFTPLKPDETRHWPLPTKLIGTPIAIHASLTDTRETRMNWEILSTGEDRLAIALELERLTTPIHGYHDFPRGCIIGWCVFGPPQHTSVMHLWPAPQRTTLQQRFGDYSPKRFAWPKQRAELFDKPYPCMGRQGFFDWTRPEEL
jgi:activating signal cointegrator 1